jgi:putative inorganic carbon (HCO3(-)) transporter
MTKATTSRPPRRNLLLFAALALIFSYLTLLGATFNGIVGLVALQPFTLGLLGLIAAAWLITHWRHNWIWHRTPLDLVFVFWIIAFAVSVAMNQHSWRRSAEGLWYMGLYIGLWYLLHDALANGGLSRQVLSQSFVFTGFFVMLFGWYHVWILLPDASFSRLPRPSSLIGNPNAFGAFLVILVPFGVVQILNARKRFPQIIMGLYTISAFLLLVLSQSRGGWIGGVAGLGILILMLLADHQLLSITALRSWWNMQPSTVRLLLIIGLIALLMMGAFMA